ncbi:SDR family NAD(P)-dependent oxidoreductase [Rhodobacteraceae bacterium B1Z28]|uniref:SDR family NAD(P)-dependent oxidoreductase n=1 Tax=Ruegeria haliotis TaxID=2747601 RepID=A0ABX2PVA5_9RHOB|nr:SDR family NAD(P)-dependent oxidoreductase [Ruegeria haliotis]NVO58118.1 SDR family NAD(P)-dependent oxidoreductase [Ruegeria haliotis]
MTKTILITGATDGIGLATARAIAALGHTVLLHGRNSEKLNAVQMDLTRSGQVGPVHSYVADLSRMEEVENLARTVADNHQSLDVLINNAGVYETPVTRTVDGLDTRFAVNTFAPYLLTRRLWTLLSTAKGSRVVNLSSAAQSPVQIDALLGKSTLSAGAAYAQSKLALTMWSSEMALASDGEGPTVIAVNPGSMLGSKMVKQAFGVAGGDISQGADILVCAALSGEFAEADGKFFDNDTGKFASPHPDAQDRGKSKAVMDAIDGFLAK